jgi:hypothetical protein
MIRNIRLLYIHNFLVDLRFQDTFRPIYFAQITGSYTLAMAVFSVTWITSALADIPKIYDCTGLGLFNGRHCDLGVFRT